MSCTREFADHQIDVNMFCQSGIHHTHQLTKIKAQEMWTMRDEDIKDSDG